MQRPTSGPLKLVKCLPILLFFLLACAVADPGILTPPAIPGASATPALALPPVACTPPPCRIGQGEVYHCPGDCPGGCGTECATVTPGPNVAVPEAPQPAAVPAVAPGSGFTIYFIDVGQGDATLIVAGTGETLLVDGGRSKDRIRDRLERLGIEDLDAIAMTHPDADHIAGLVEVLELYTIEGVY